MASKTEGFARWVHEWKIHQQTVKDGAKIHIEMDEKSMQIPWSNDHARNMENNKIWKTKRLPKQSNIDEQKNANESCSKKQDPVVKGAIPTKTGGPRT